MVDSTSESKCGLESSVTDGWHMIDIVAGGESSDWLEIELGTIENHEPLANDAACDADSGAAPRFEIARLIDELVATDGNDSTERGAGVDENADAGVQLNVMFTVA